jgi:hypothetical protein
VRSMRLSNQHPGEVADVHRSAVLASLLTLPRGFYSRNALVAQLNDHVDAAAAGVLRDAVQEGLLVVLPSAILDSDGDIDDDQLVNLDPKRLLANGVRLDRAGAVLELAPLGVELFA